MILANGDLSGTQGRFSAAKLSWASGRPRLPSLPRTPTVLACNFEVGWVRDEARNFSIG